MRALFTLACLFFLFGNIMFAQTPEEKLSSGEMQTPEEKLTGNWYSEELSHSIVCIYKDGEGMLCGKIIESDQTEKIGEIPLTDFSLVEEENKFIGTLHPASSPSEFSGEIRFIDNNTIELTGTKFLLRKPYRLTKDEK